MAELQLVHEQLLADHLSFQIKYQKAKEERAESRKEVEEVATQIQIITNEIVRENAEAKQSLANLENDHANEIKTLNQNHQQEVTAKQTIIADLVAQIEIMTSETEEAVATAKEEIAILEENHRKSAEQQRQIIQTGNQKAKEECAKKLEELSAQIQNIKNLEKVLENAEAKHSLANLKNDHANEIKILNQKHQQEVTANQKKIDGLVAQIEIMTSEKKKVLAKANEEIGILEENHLKLAEIQSKNLQTLREKQVMIDNLLGQEKSQDEIDGLEKRNEELKKTLRGRDAMILSLKNTSARTETIMADLRVSYEKSIEELRENFEADHQKAMEELKNKLEREHEQEMIKKECANQKTISYLQSQYKGIIANLSSHQRMQVNTPIP
ncbi:girdin-like [Contarinia nasturtii]|uniref:girdin-like n=1 Tax=Contarinia nasturtii TaxID=265458 RepID=UPI0012D4020F|nr:girdin-like [Contarinia nasturtii]